MAKLRKDIRSAVRTAKLVGKFALAAFLCWIMVKFTVILSALIIFVILVMLGLILRDILCPQRRNICTVEEWNARAAALTLAQEQAEKAGATMVKGELIE